MGFIEKLQSKLELYRLEKRYTLNRHRRATFVSNAMYVDGEYVYQTPNVTGSSTNSSSSSTPSYKERGRSMEAPPVSGSPDQAAQPASASQSKRLQRFSSIAGFGSLSSRRR